MKSRMKFARTSVPASMMLNAIYGMRNPMNSWNRSNSKVDSNLHCIIGENDLKLARTLIKSGTDHSKFMRQIPVSVQITAPEFWWPEMDQYKVGTATNSTSKMHKLISDKITQECFYQDIPDTTLHRLKTLQLWSKDDRDNGVSDHDNEHWNKLLNELPLGWLQTRMWSANYAVLRNIYFARRNHKQECWREFCRWIETLPYAEELICYDPNKIEKCKTSDEIIKREG